jgi:hypothetical protein
MGGARFDALTHEACQSAVRDVKVGGGEGL